MDALVWLLVGLGAGVGLSLMLLTLYSSVERFRLGQRIRRARVLRDKVSPPELAPSVAVARLVPSDEIRETRSASQMRGVRALREDTRPAVPVARPTRPVVVEPPEVAAHEVEAASARSEATPAAEVPAVAPVRVGPRPVVEEARSPAVRQDVKPAPKPVPKPEVRPAPAVTAKAAISAPVESKEPPTAEVKPVAKPRIVAANDSSSKPKLTVVTGDKPPAAAAKPVVGSKTVAAPQPTAVEIKPTEAVKPPRAPITKAKRFAAPDAGPEPTPAPVAEPAPAPVTELEPAKAVGAPPAPVVEPVPAAADGAKPAPEPIRNVKALFGESFAIEKLTVPGALPLPDKGSAETK